MASSQLTKTFSGNGSATTHTISMWVKRSAIDTIQRLFFTGSGSNQYQLYFLHSAGTYDNLLQFEFYDGSTNYYLRTNRQFKDTSAWYHIVAVWDTTNATSGDRMRLYINGVRETSFAVEQQPTQNFNGYCNQSTYAHRIGASDSGSNFDGLMTHVHSIDGTAYNADTFGQTDSTSGIWKPKTSPSVTYGTNGFFLKFANSASLGLDSSGNTNNFTVSGTGTQTQDTPSNNFCTMNPLDNYYESSTFNNGNTTVVTPSSGYSGVIGGMGAASGKWYFEFKPVSKTGDADEYTVGITGAPVTSTGQPHYRLATGYMYLGVNGQSYNNDTGTAYGNTFTAGDIIGVAMDLDNNKLYFSKNGTWQNSGDPESGSTGTGAISITAPGSTPIGFYIPCCAFVSNTQSATMSFNFGNGYFGTTAVASSNSDGDGIGLFEYSVPSGYYALCTKNIKNYG